VRTTRWSQNSPSGRKKIRAVQVSWRSQVWVLILMAKMRLKLVLRKQVGDFSRKPQECKLSQPPGPQGRPARHSPGREAWVETASRTSTAGAALTRSIDQDARGWIGIAGAAPTALTLFAGPTQASRPGLYLAGRPFGPGGRATWTPVASRKISNLERSVLWPTRSSHADSEAACRRKLFRHG
jgi:hypothetical protein